MCLGLFRDCDSKKDSNIHIYALYGQRWNTWTFVYAIIIYTFLHYVNMWFAVEATKYGLWDTNCLSMCIDLI